MASISSSSSASNLFRPLIRSKNLKHFGAIEHPNIGNLIFSFLPTKATAKLASVDKNFQDAHYKKLNTIHLSFRDIRDVVASTYTNLNLNPRITWVYWIHHQFPPSVQLGSESVARLSEEFSKRFWNLKSLDINHQNIHTFRLVCELFAKCNLTAIDISGIPVTEEDRTNLRRIFPMLTKLNLNDEERGFVNPEIRYTEPEGPDPSIQAIKHITWNSSCCSFTCYPKQLQYAHRAATIAIVGFVALIIFYIIRYTNPEIINMLAKYQVEIIISMTVVGILAFSYCFIKGRNL